MVADKQAKQSLMDCVQEDLPGLHCQLVPQNMVTALLLTAARLQRL